MGVVVEALHEPLAHVLVDEGVVGDLVDPLVELLGGGQLSVDQQVRHLEVGRLLGQLLDRVAAVAQHAVVAVEVGDRARGQGRRHERRVREPDARQQLAPGVGGDSAIGDRYLDGFACAVVSDGDRFSHGSPSLGGTKSDTGMLAPPRNH